MNELTIDLAVFEPLVADHKERFNGGFAKISKAALCPNSCFFGSYLYSAECWENGISHNDPMRENIMIERVGEDDYIATLDGGSLTIHARPEDKFQVYSSVKCGFRKTKGNAEKIIKAILKWQDKRLALVKECKREIPHIEKSNLKDI